MDWHYAHRCYVYHHHSILNELGNDDSIYVGTHDDAIKLGWHYSYKLGDIVEMAWYCPRHTSLWEERYQAELKELNSRYGRIT